MHEEPTSPSIAGAGAGAPPPLKEEEEDDDEEQQQRQGRRQDTGQSEAEEEPAPLFFLGDSAFSVYEEMARQLRQLGWRETRSKGRIVRCDLVLGDRFSIPYALLRCERLPATSRYGGYRCINYFRGSHRLTLKASMARLISAADATHAEWMPTSFVLGGDQRKRPDDREAFLQLAEQRPGAAWIIKPSSGSKGKDILLTRGPAGVAAFIGALDPSSHSIFVAQRYVDRPLLYRGRKFDLRVWAFLTAPYDIYAFAQGSCRTSSVPYDADDVGNTLAHLTNHCLQEGSPQFGQHEGGNEVWFPQLAAYLRGVYAEDVLGARILPQVSNIIVRSLLAVREELELPPDAPYRCFQLFGYDLLVDDRLNVLLLEINGSPGVATKYLEPLVREALALVGGGDAPREWDLDAVRFVKLWGAEDALPDGAARA
ncbi:putative tubulin-tyrosine ligase [Trypanosoma conorhini]|uniref:Tubulin--tyrosine ligase n=1 Tax=Trypanosoma conorhini TaxID=83891 RepID=A0A422MVL1_9TRYP|nr:putative tubulin-tyrosine ligase [Trypanosoma conorhini]RNE97275.1 putative tubulin-tyrosine ligase [Trypanosoma conorhini]